MGSLADLICENTSKHFKIKTSENKTGQDNISCMKFFYRISGGLIRIFFKLLLCRCCFKGHPLRVRRKQELGREFTLLLPKATESKT